MFNINNGIITINAGDEFSFKFSFNYDNASTNIIEVTYNELINLIDTLMLEPGSMYRIIDYTPKIVFNNKEFTITGSSYDVVFVAEDSSTLSENILLVDSGDEVAYEMGENDELLFAIVEPNQPFEFGVVRKIFNYDAYDSKTRTVTISLNSSDTLNLLPGRYYYEIKLRKNVASSLSNESLVTVQSRRLFYIL